MCRFGLLRHHLIIIIIGNDETLIKNIILKLIRFITTLIIITVTFIIEFKRTLSKAFRQKCLGNTWTDLYRWMGIVKISLLFIYSIFPNSQKLAKNSKLENFIVCKSNLHYKFTALGSMERYRRELAEPKIRYAKTGTHVIELFGIDVAKISLSCSKVYLVNMLSIFVLFQAFSLAFLYRINLTKVALYYCT